MSTLKANWKASTLLWINCGMQILRTHVWNNWYCSYKMFVKIYGFYWKSICSTRARFEAVRQGRYDSGAPKGVTLRPYGKS